jgi:hypothetical protein
MRTRWLYPAAVIALAAIGIVTGIAVGSRHAAPQLTLQLAPTTTLTMRACVAEVTPAGYTVAAARSICSFGRERPWYHARLTNNGAGAYPSCSANGFDSRGKIVFSGPLVFSFGGFPDGLYAKGHRSTAFSWYLPRAVSRQVERYVAVCQVDASPPT